MKSVAFIFFLLLIASVKGISQEYNYYHYDAKDGLNAITIYSIAQDKDGFLWFGTETGLSKFDGNNFTNYSANDGLNETEIINLFVDSKNRVWIFPFRNSIYYYYHGKIYNASNDPLLRQFHLKNEIFKASEDKNGNIFFLEQKKIHVLSASNKLTEVNKINNRYFDNNGCGITSDGNCNLYISLLNNAIDYRVSVYEYRNQQLLSKGSFPDSNFSRNALQINPHFGVIRNGSFFQIYDQKTNAYFKLKVPDHFHTISYINDSCFAISTFNKTLLYNVNQKKIVDSFLINKVINRCFNDRDNNLWFAGMTQGLYRLSSTKFKSYRIENNFNYMPVYALDFFNGQLYIGSDKQLWKLNLKSNELKVLDVNINYVINHVSNIEVLNDKDFFLGSNIGLFEINNNQASVYLSDLSIKSAFVYDTSLIVATDRAVFELPLLNPTHRYTIWNSRATCAYKINGQYYIGTLNGLYAVQKEHANSIIDFGKTFPILRDKIISIKADLNGNLWIATESNGLICIENSKVIHQLTIKDGLSSNLCRCLYISDNKLWLGTNKGISEIDISQSFHVTNFTAADGLDYEIINCIYVKNDSVFAGTPFGVTFFEADKIQTESVCRLRLIDIQSRNSNWYYNQDSIYLLSNDKFFRIEYVAVPFATASDVTYYYQLQGLDSTWQSTKQTSIEFQLLHPGNYKFNIYAVDKYGVKSKTVSVSFTKAKTFWQLLWVQTLLIITVAFLIWLLFQSRIRAIRKKAQKNLMREKQIFELEQMALRAQMNPHFIFNSLNSIQQYVFAGDIIEANQFITSFSSLVRQTLYISGKKFITVAEEIKYLDTYLNLEQCKYENVFNFQIERNENVHENIPVPPLLLQPFIENSIRHGVLNMEENCGKIHIHFSIKDSMLQCLIEDNGIGRHNALKLKSDVITNHQSKGMELVQKRIESLNSIYNINIIVLIEDIAGKDATGTRVIIKLPLHYDES